MHHGFTPTLMEAGDSLGGIWRRTCSITKLQSTSARYQFSDFPWPNGTPPHPHHQQVLDYFDSYAAHFHIKDKILFNCKVVEIKCTQVQGPSMLWGGKGSAFANINGNRENKVWDVRVERRDFQLDDKVHHEWLQFDFLVLCVGRYGDPSYPTFPLNRGPDSFSGKVMHAMEYAMLDNASAQQMLKGKRVIVVGYMKSAIDITMEATTANQGAQGHPCHLIFRTTNWITVDRNLFGKFLSLFYLTHFAELMHPKPGQGWLLSILSVCLCPLKWLSSKVIELYLLWHLPLLKYGLVPKHSFWTHASACKTFLVPDEFFPRVEEGEIVLHKTGEWSFCKDGVVLHDGTFVPADVVILGTGFDSHKKILSLLPIEYSSLLLDPSGVIPLYRGTIHPRIPHLAILGYQLKSSYMLASEMSARWLAHFLQGSFSLPSVLDMEKNAQQWIRHMSAVSPFFHQKVCNASAPIWHCDEMCRDFGWNPWRKTSWFQELFSPYSNLDYKEP
ncbi:hypothetical protein GOP47_0010297 [Adiantum capillus-veneris]|uniref:Flavin-containing monooxygenase n=1 Tax=Adiantum capillus-veneris TaxID=13818 RepID=A0A9D4ZIM2_ADICA|nr:hypothetical protein GOP47_0010297 [Adiantum capillus-veneris]